MPRNRSTPYLSITCKPRADSTTSPGSAGVLSTSSNTLRPTMSSASSVGLVSAVVTVATISPRRMTLTSSVTSMISRSLWVIRTMVFPCSLSPRRMRNR